MNNRRDSGTGLFNRRNSVGMNNRRNSAVRFSIDSKQVIYLSTFLSIYLIFYLSKFYLSDFLSFYLIFYLSI